MMESEIRCSCFNANEAAPAEKDLPSLEEIQAEISHYIQMTEQVDG